MKPLEGIRILDLTRILAGPWCTQNLADLGADVIKVERLGSGDDTRHWGPPFWPSTQEGETGPSAYFTCANRAKKSVAIDFTTQEGGELLADLAAECDVVVENFMVGGLARYGLDYESLSARRPGLVYCSVSGFGQAGPWAYKPGYDYIAQGLSGLMSVTGEAEGRPGAGPQKVGVAVTDLMTGMYAALAIVAALRRRDATGEGEHIDVNLMDTAVSMMANVAASYLANDRLPERLGNAHATIVPYQVFAASDGHLIVAVGNDAQFARLAVLLGVPELGTDPLFERNVNRVRNRNALIPMLEPLFAAQPAAVWLARLEVAAIPGGPIHRVDEMFASDHAVARNLRVPLPPSGVGGGVRVQVVANPIRLREAPITYEEGVPELGQHTESVLSSVLGLAAARIASLRAAGVIQS